MELVAMSKDALEVMQKKIADIELHMRQLTRPEEQILNNIEFMKLMKISARTAQTWRDEGKIGFSQEGRKVFYTMKDIKDFLTRHYREPFSVGGRGI